MLRTVPYTKKYDSAFEALSPDKAEVLRFHKDVIPGTKTAVVGERFLGAGFLQAGQSYRARETYPSPPYYSVQMDFALDFSNPEAVPAAELLLNALIGHFDALQAKEPEKPLALTYWVQTNARETRAFFESFGFREAYRSYRMVRELSEEPAGGTEEGFKTFAPDPRITEADLLDPALMKRYISYTAEAYGVPDSEAEMLFRIRQNGARVFTIEEKTFVTVWDLGNGDAATENVFTRKEFRRQGLSRSLLDGAAAILREEGFERLFLNVYPKFAASALKLYRSIGYKRAYTLIEMHRMG